MFSLRRSGVPFLLVVSCFGLAHRAGTADDKGPEKLTPPETAQDKGSDKLSGWQKLFRKHSSEYVIRADSLDSPSLQLVREPILNWSQPVRGGADGAVFVWTQAGRPLVIGTMFIWPQKDGKQGITHELHSLSTAPLVGIWRNRTWTPPKDSIVWNPLVDAPAPAATPDQRLRQMRDLARRFSAESYDKEERKWDLRLLPRHIYRYDFAGQKTEAEADREIPDGALFGFVEGTDLEIVLLIQAHKTDAGPRWEYALARMSDFHLIARLGERTVWEADRRGFDNPDPRLAYYCSTVESRLTADDE
jgi:hypothetical protein